MRKILPVMLIFALVAAVGQRFERSNPAPAAELPEAVAEMELEVERPGANERSNFSCDGRKHCSQMKSCEEATYFIRNCPGVKMDGDRDGVPCEEQWCASGR